MKNSIIFIIIGIVILGSISYVILRQKNDAPSIAASTETAVLSSPNPDSELQESPITDSDDTLLAGGSSFLDPKGVYTFLYPSDYTLDNDGEHVRISKRGATQKGQTEMYDGVIVVFESIDLKGKTLEQWVDSQIAETTTGGTLSVTEPKTATTVKGYPGFTYATSGLGEGSFVVLQKDKTAQKAVVITYSVFDPEKMNYQAEVSSVISTLELL